MRVPALALAALVVASVATPAVASAAAPTCADLAGVLDAARTCRIQATDPAYSLSISYPVEYPDQQAVVDYVKQTHDGFVNVAQAPGAHAMPYELDTTAKESSSAPPRATRSLVLTTFQDVGGAHPQTFFQSFSWDEAARRPITIDSLFRPGTAPFPVLLPLVQAELQRQSGQPVSIAPGMGLDPQKYRNFTIQDDSLTFYFGQGELLPESAGAVEVTVPRAPLDAMLA